MKNNKNEFHNSTEKLPESKVKLNDQATDFFLFLFLFSGTSALKVVHPLFPSAMAKPVVTHTMTVTS